MFIMMFQSAKKVTKEQKRFQLTFRKKIKDFFSRGVQRPLSILFALRKIRPRIPIVRNQRLIMNFIINYRNLLNSKRFHIFLVEIIHIY